MQDRNERRVDKLIERANVKQIRARASLMRSSELQRKLEREQAKADHDYMIYRSAEIEYERDPVTEIPDEVKLPMDYFDEVANKVEYNQVYAEHYMHRFEDTNKDKYRSMSERLAGCHKSWFGDHYKKMGVFNTKRVFHCHNRWCWLCSHLKQAKNLYKYTLMFERIKNDYDLYHIVFTVKNVKGGVLQMTVEKMQDALKKIIRYFQNDGKIKGLDFEQYGFSGAIRCFEIVINPTDYHPHLHVLMTLKKGLELPGRHINKFSFDKNNPGVKRPFTDLEILLQKMFYLAVNGQRLTPKNIDALKIGYSVHADCIPFDTKAWHDVFKYATKMSKDGASTASYEQFCLLDDILHRMRTIQGYGIFYDMDKVEDDADPTAEILFEKILIFLNDRETPEREVYMELNKLVDELHQKKLTVISKNMSYKYMQTVIEDFRAELGIQDGDFPF